MQDRVLDVELVRAMTAPRAARTVMEERFAGELSDTELDSARLLVSELVTNEVLHGRGRITLRARLDEDRLLVVEVIDEGNGFKPAPRPRNLEDPAGSALGPTIVDTESSRWGIHRGTTHVWFEPDRPRPPIIVRPAPVAAEFV